MAKHKLKPIYLKPKLRNLALKLIIVLAIIFLIVFLFIYLCRTLKNLDYFKIKDIITNRNISVDLSYLKGQNIFAVDMPKESDYLTQIYPDFKLIRLIRILPNRLFVYFIERKPLAYVELYRHFCVDEDSVLFDLPKQAEETDLPLISGLDTKIFGPKSGKQYNLKELRLALDIIGEAKRNRTLRNYKITRIDVIKPDNTSFVIVVPSKVTSYPRRGNYGEVEVIEIKIGQDYIRDRIAILGNLLIQAKKNPKDIKYIDLRFKEPAIKYKDVK